nr:cytochrome c [uncultured Chitinophaga sp.]
MKYILCLLLLCLLFACHTATRPDWKTIDYGPFKLKSPPEWKQVKLHGIDSYVGGLTNGKDTLTFDYGWYSPHVDVDSSGAWKEDTVNGLAAIVGISGNDVQMEIHLKDPKDRFFISGRTLKDVPTALRIFKTIYFPYSDTTVNPPLAVDKFHPGTLATGNELYQMNCATCHHPAKQLTGPSFAEILEYRDEDRIFQFLTNRDALKSDSLTMAFQKRAGSVECIRWPELTRIELSRILRHVK